MNKQEIHILKIAVKDIENWKGDAYQHGDDIDNAVSSIKVLISESEHNISEKKI